MRTLARIWPGLLAVLLLCGIGAADRYAFQKQDRMPALSAVTLPGEEAISVIQCAGEVLVIWPDTRSGEQALHTLLQGRHLTRIDTLVILQGDGANLGDAVSVGQILSPEEKGSRHPLTLGAAGGQLTFGGTEGSYALTLYHGATRLLFTNRETVPGDDYDFVQFSAEGAALPWPAGHTPSHAVVCDTRQRPAANALLAALKKERIEYMCTGEGAVRLYLDEDTLRLLPEGSRIP